MAAPTKPPRRPARPDYYPPSPPDPPELELTSGAYRWRVVAVLVSLFLFLLLYLGLVAGSCYLTYWLLTPPRTGAAGREAATPFLIQLGLAASSAMLTLFLVKGLFRRMMPDTEGMIPVTEKDQPRLVNFVHRVCAETGSPFPHRIYLSHEVNAAVFYPRSLLTLFWPAKKNLLVGMGLARALNLSEFKSVLAHEFGHFAQASMKLGQYVYVANQVIGNMVFGRDFWDDFLRQWRRIDIRLSFPAWILSAVVWVLRRVLELLFKAMNVFNFSLMRQMEFAADRQAVAVAGSDNHVRALWKSGRAAIAQQVVAGELASLAEHKHYTADFFFHLEKGLGRLDGVLRRHHAEEDQGAADLARPYRPGPKSHFSAPRERRHNLWDSHPEDYDREREAKNPYVAAPADERPAALLIKGRPETIAALTRQAYQEIIGKKPAAGKLRPAEEIESLLQEERAELEQAEHYHGLYQDRVVKPGDPEALAGQLDRAAAEGALDREELRREAAAWTGDSLGKHMARIRELQRDADRLVAIAQGELRVSGLVEWRGKQYRKKEIPALLDRIGKRLDQRHDELAKADRAFFRYFYALAGERRPELLRRYRFLLFVQELITGLNDMERKLGPVLELLQEGRELSPNEAEGAKAVFRRGQRRLTKTVRRCGEVRLPQIARLEEDATVKSFVLPGRVVGPLPDDDERIGPWINNFLQQFARVLERLRKLHFKNLGQLLHLQESLDPDLFAEEAADAP